LELTNNTIGGTNTANGYQALSSNTTGIGNTAIGNGALDGNTTGDDNIALGVAAGSSVATANNVISIGATRCERERHDLDRQYLCYNYGKRDNVASRCV